MRHRPRPLPPRLRRGDAVGVAAIASPPTRAALAGGVSWLEEAGFRVLVAAPRSGRGEYTAGADEERVAALHELVDRGVGAIIAARGGYGVMRLLPRLDFQRLARWGGWVVGFSDITALHAALAPRFPAATLHGPLAVTLRRHPASARLLADWLTGKTPRRLFTFGPSRVVRGGTARGVAVGGNLSMLAAMVGTPWEPFYEDSVLFIEDVNEPGYSLDRLLTQLRLSSRLDRVKAVVAGRMARCGLGEPGWRDRWRRVLAEAASDAAVVVEGLPFGHGLANVPIPLGVEVEIDTARGTVVLGGR